MKKFLLRVALFILVLVAGLELCFRFALPASQWPATVVLQSGIRKFDQTAGKTGRFTYGRYCEGGFRWSVNSQGWNSIYDYQLPGDRVVPMVAILGDSYLEGFYSHVDQHIDVYLTEIFHSRAVFNTFAMSGCFLSQYVALAQFETAVYEPSAYVIFINSGDVRKSFRHLDQTHPYYFQYDVSPDPENPYVQVIPSASSRSALKDLLLESALVRYLKVNAQLSLLGAGLRDDNANFNGDSDTSEEEPSQDLIEAADFILNELNSLGVPVILVADCPRDWIYNGEPAEAFPDVYVIKELAGAYPNVQLVELAGFYVSDYQINGRLFSHERNPHWDGETNRFIAGVVAPYVAEILTGESE